MDENIKSRNRPNMKIYYMIKIKNLKIVELKGLLILINGVGSTG